MLAIFNCEPYHNPATVPPLKCPKTKCDIVHMFSFRTLHFLCYLPQNLLLAPPAAMFVFLT